MLMSKYILRSAILAAALVCGAGVQAATPVSANDWQTALALYGWFPTIGGSLKYPLPSGDVADVEADPGDYLQNLQFAFMGSFVARKNDWSILADLIYLDLSGQKGKATVSGFDLNADNSLKGTLFQLAGAYTVARGESANLDVLVGLRYAGFDTETNLSLQGPFVSPHPADSAAVQVCELAGRHHRRQGSSAMGRQLVLALLP